MDYKSLFKADNIFSASTNLSYGPHKQGKTQTILTKLYKYIQANIKSSRIS